jgi:hypothetical protein
MLESPSIPIILVAGGLIVLLMIWIGRIRLQRSSGAQTSRRPLIPSGISLAPQPLMTRAEASFYNVLRLAVQDHYLLFPQIPLWCVVDVRSGNPKARRIFLTHIALKRLDYVLVHPGTLMVVKIVELEDASSPSSQRQVRNRLIDEVVKAAGIELIRIPAQPSYTVPEIAALLDPGSME